MRNQNRYKAGVWNALCDVCGQKYKSDQLLKRWDGLMTCKGDWEPRHPQDLIRAIKETSTTLPWSRPDNDGIAGGPTYPLYVDDDYIADQFGSPYIEEIPS